MAWPKLDSVGSDVWRRIHRLLVMHLSFRAAWEDSSCLLAPVSAPGASVSKSTIDRHVSSFVTSYGDGVSAEGYTSHSLRIGAASAMLAAGVSRSVVRVWFRWKSEGMVDLYARVVACDAAVKELYGWMLHAGQSFTLYC